MDSRTFALGPTLARCALSLVMLTTVAVSPSVRAGSGDQVFATVDKEVITVADFSQALLEGVRKKYYHGKIPEQEQAQFQREIASSLIDRTLLLRAAKSLKLTPDEGWVSQRLASIEQRAQRHPQWATHRDRMMARARARLEQDSVLKHLESQIRNVTAPTQDQLLAFYNDNPKLFTEPERFRISAILLRVQPSAGSPIWEAAQKEAQTLVDKLRAGASFEELARLHSSDGSAAQGGDMGYLHRGMLGAPAEKAIDDLQVGQITEPVTLLEGVAIFRLDERPTAKLREFNEVKSRAAGLWTRNQSEQSWQSYLENLRAAADIQVYDKHLLRPSANDAVAQ